MGTVTAYGREFNFADDITPEVQQRRIQSWMKMHAPDEMAPAEEPGKNTPTGSAPAGHNSTLAAIAQAASAALPGVNLLTASPWGKNRTGDPNFYRTLAQGALPVADEAVAGIRSLMPGGPDYTTALGEERQGVKDYGDKVGETEKFLTEVLGGVGGTALTMGAGTALQGTRAAAALGNLASKAPGAAKMADLAAKYPRIASVLGSVGTGAGTAGAAGFGAGEGDFGSRLDNAGGMAAIGAGLGLGAHTLIRGAQKAGDLFNVNNRVAEFLRKRLPQDRGEAYDAMGNTMPRTRTGEVDTAHPNFANLAGDELEAALAKQRGLSQATARGQRGTDVMTADVMPGTLESITQSPGEDTGRLARSVIKRQFDPTLPVDQQAAASQYGQVGKWFDRIFGNSNFRGDEEALLATRKAAADAGFTPAFQKNIHARHLNDALDDPYVEQAWKAAKMKMDAERKPIGIVNPVNEHISQYNTEFLHKLKTTMDDMVTSARSQPAGTTGPDTARIIGKSKERLNQAIMEHNPEYKAAMKEFGDHSASIDALRQGRENVFGKNVNELDKGVGKEDIEAFLRDPTKSNAEKDLYRVGAARALRSNLLGSDAKNFTHNWADVLNKPNMVEKYNALVDPQKLGSWDMMVGQMRQLSDRHKAMSGALGNSKTASRLQKQEELNAPNMLAEMVATGVSPHAPSTWRNWVREIFNPAAAGRATANATAKILNKTGRAGNTEAVQQIRDLLGAHAAREARFTSAKNIAAGAVPYSDPYRHFTRQPSDTGTE